MKQVIRIILYMISIVSVTGCSKDETEERPQDGILIRVEAPTINGWSTEKMTGTRNLETNTARQKGEDGLDMEADLRPDYEGTAGKEATTRWTNIDNNTTFRVVAYGCDAVSGISTSNYAGCGDYKLSGSSVQTTRSLILPPGTYTFICYSYGNASAMPAFSRSSTSVSVTNGQNFMTYVKSGVIINNAGNTYTLSNIVFEHHCARYRILAKAQAGRMGNITACTGTLTLPKSNATYNFTNNSFTTHTGSGTLNVAWSNPNGMNVYSNYTYLIPQSSASITVALNLTVGGKIFNKSATLSGLTLIPNKTYYSSISFTTTQGYIIGGALWANGNLYYTGTFNIYNDTWKITKDKTKEFWCWNMLYPNTTLVTVPNSDWAESLDPCRKISQANTWRLPTAHEMQGLIDCGYQNHQINNVDGLLFDGMLFLPVSGFYTDSNELKDANRGLYWVEDRGGVQGRMLDFRLNGINSTAEVTYSDWKINLMVIRCVRAD